MKWIPKTEINIKYKRDKDIIIIIIIKNIDINVYIGYNNICMNKKEKDEVSR